MIEDHDGEGLTNEADLGRGDIIDDLEELYWELEPELASNAEERDTRMYIAELLRQRNFNNAWQLAQRASRLGVTPTFVRELSLALWQMNQVAERTQGRLDQIMGELSTSPRIVVPVVGVERNDGQGTRVLVAAQGELLEVAMGPEAREREEEIKVGRAVCLSRDRSVILRATNRPYPFRVEGRVVGLSSDGSRALVDFGSHHGRAWVCVGEDLRLTETALTGKPVLGDPRIGLINALAPSCRASDGASRPAMGEVVFAGHWRVRKLLEDIVIDPLRDPEAYIRRRVANAGNSGFPIVVMLSGPTGSGKSHAARWVASEAGEGAVLIERHPANYRTPWFGESENLVVADIERTAHLVEEGQARCAVLVINEVEAILLNRSCATHSSVQSTLLAIVDSFLAAVDTLSHSHAETPVAIVLTTNMPELLDAAALSGHRLAAAIKVGYLESVEELAEVCCVHLQNYRVDASEAESLGARLADLIWSEEARLLEATVQGERRTILARDVASPALVVGILRAASGKAMKNGDGAGITWQELVEATCEVLARHAEVVAQDANGPNGSITLPQFPSGSVSQVRVVFQPALLAAAAL